MRLYGIASSVTGYLLIRRVSAAGYAWGWCQMTRCSRTIPTCLARVHWLLSHKNVHHYVLSGEPEADCALISGLLVRGWSSKSGVFMKPNCLLVSHTSDVLECWLVVADHEVYTRCVEFTIEAVQCVKIVCILDTHQLHSRTGPYWTSKSVLEPSISSF